jgi:diguanylate cyclase (GGDEF)-like protein/PAS domain S-box-containing protein
MDRERVERHLKASQSQRLYYFMFLPVVIALIAIWGVAIGIKSAGRSSTLNQAKTQLSATISTLADFSELAQKSGAVTADEATAQRTAAIWRALLQYPTASIWVESSGRTVDGQPPAGAQVLYIFVEEKRANFTVHAALPETDVLATWRWEAWWEGAILAILSLSFLFLTHILIRAIRRRNEAETNTMLERRHTAQLSEFQIELKQTVADRTQELRGANVRLESELHERQAAEKALREHDALLNAVTKSAAELLGSRSYETAIAAVLELIGQTIAVVRVQLCGITSGMDGHLLLNVAQEWCAPGQSPIIDSPHFKNVDLTMELSRATAPILSGQHQAFFVDDIPETHREKYLQAQMQSFLHIPVMIDRKLWGVLAFIDSAATRRKWSWAETDALQTLAGLIGVAIIRARYVKDLADANMIVQNSPTILYRLGGTPALPLVYISPNIAKFGHDRAKLMAAANWAEQLIDPEDLAKFGEAMTTVLRKDSTGGTVEFRLRTGDDTRRSVENRYTPVRDKLDRLIEIEGIIIDITERKIAEEKIALLARTDGLTGLANRTTFVDRLRQAFSATKRGASPFAVLYMDADHFKDVNDTLGHPVGDLLLKAISERLKVNTRENDIVARLGGDEFAILQTEMDDPARAGELATKLLHALAEPYQLGHNDVHITISIGIAPYVPETAGPDIMLTQADLALYRAKEQGRNRYRFHTDDLDEQVRQRVNLTLGLREALEKDQLELYYQPKVEVVSGKIVGVEALVRWNHPTRGLLLPADFLPAAEQSGVIMLLGHWVLDHACEQMRRWQDAAMAPDVMTVNLSLMQLKNGRELVQDVVEVLAKWNLKASDLEFDVTEATLAQLKWSRNDVLAQLRRLGTKIAIDDFGTEYSSFDYLKSYHVNHLKIARSLISKAVAEPERADIIRVMIAMARELGLSIMAEGVETDEQRALLISTGSPTKAQGFLFSEALDAANVSKLLVQRHIKPLPDTTSSPAQDVEPDPASGVAKP